MQVESCLLAMSTILMWFESLFNFNVASPNKSRNLTLFYQKYENNCSNLFNRQNENKKESLDIRKCSM